MLVVHNAKALFRPGALKANGSAGIEVLEFFASIDSLCCIIQDRKLQLSVA